MYISKMVKLYFIISLLNLIIMNSANNQDAEESYTDDEKPAQAFLYDFTTLEDVNDWTEQSDTVRQAGMSVAAIVLQKTQLFQRAIFFTLLNPQPNGAGFAGVRVNTLFDLSDYDSISLNVRGQGANKWYKVVLRHKNLNDEPHPTFEQIFEAPMGEFYTVRLPLDKFKPYYRGKVFNESEPLDKSHITSIGLQMYGGVYLPIKQTGTSSLEIDWIKADQ